MLNSFSGRVNAHVNIKDKDFTLVSVLKHLGGREGVLRSAIRDFRLT